MQRILGCLFLGIFTVVGLTRAADSSISGSREGQRSAIPAGLAWQGVGSCASTACHGATGGAVKQGEYSLWIDRDRHARGYQVLFDERSRRMIENLYGTDAQPAHRTGLCLDCHAVNLAVEQGDQHYLVGDGVGCENCHGPAQRWRTEHYLPSWRLKSPQEKETLGMRQTKDLVIRAKVCVECHVGSGEKDVNHDLIAAGHPRLNFEYGLFTARMPRHWSAREEKSRDPDFEARMWAVGQVVSSEAALNLLAYRAESAASNKKPWPEFAEYSCFACHHALRDSDPPPAAARAGRLGDAPWGTWYFALAPLLANTPTADDAALARLRQSMAAGRPNPARVASEARQVAEKMRKWSSALQERRYDVADFRRLLRSVAERGASTTTNDWDSAAQEYLAAAALYHGLTDLAPQYRDASVRRALDDSVQLLEVRPPNEYPVHFDAISFRRRMQAIQDQLSR